MFFSPTDAFLVSVSPFPFPAMSPYLTSFSPFFIPLSSSAIPFLSFTLTKFLLSPTSLFFPFLSPTYISLSVGYRFLSNAYPILLILLSSLSSSFTSHLLSFLPPSDCLSFFYAYFSFPPRHPSPSPLICLSVSHYFPWSLSISHFPVCRVFDGPTSPYIDPGLSISGGVRSAAAASPIHQPPAATAATEQAQPQPTRRSQLDITVSESATVSIYHISSLKPHHSKN